MHSTETPAAAHPFDYYYRPGMALRPPPPRATASELWFAPRRKMLSPWIDVRPTPADTPRTRMMADHLWQGDEAMDGVVTAFRRIGTARGRRMFDRALDHGIDAIADPPPELVTLFEQLDNPPDWFDPELWEYGRRLWLNVSTAGKLAMGVQDFMGTFVGAEVASATGATGRFVNDPYRRNLETSTWFWNVTRPGCMDRWSPVFKDTVRVRLMHAQVRSGLRKAWGEEHFEQHGNPISNATMMGAAVTFGISPMCFDHVHGRRFSTAQFDAAMHYWAYIAYVFGVAEELIPHTALAGMEMSDYMVATAGVAPEWTDTMAGAATKRLRGSGIRTRLAAGATAPLLGMLAYYSSADLVRTLVSDTPLRSVPIQPWATLTAVASTTNVWLRAVDDRLPGARWRMTRRTDGDDPAWRLNTRITRLLAERAGIRDTPYDHHDGTADGPARCPIR
ncbi:MULTISPECIES: oxygenase MpaB family protein [unclassified Nocardia]|uniref:oxygenase MpaB family protein n=1 Tax=unclassified Nocardia TaxID=2637762 RepID=UPI001CE49F2E|nr:MULTISPECIES: oxygenase MpaB family protein [unclassified Nocardia]